MITRRKYYRVIVPSKNIYAKKPKKSFQKINEFKKSEEIPKSTRKDGKSRKIPQEIQIKFQKIMLKKISKSQKFNFHFWIKSSSITQVSSGQLRLSHRYWKNGFYLMQKTIHHHYWIENTRLSVSFILPTYFYVGFQWKGEGLDNCGTFVIIIVMYKQPNRYWYKMVR